MWCGSVCSNMFMYVILCSSVYNTFHTPFDTGTTNAVFFLHKTLTLNICSAAVSPSRGIRSWYTDKPVSLTAISFIEDCGKRVITWMLPSLFHAIWSFLPTRFNALHNDTSHVIQLTLKWPTWFQIPYNNSSSTTSLYQLFSWTGTILIPYSTTALHEVCDCTSDVLRVVALAASNHDVFFHLSVLPLTYPFILPTDMNPLCVECLTWKLVSVFHFGL